MGLNNCKTTSDNIRTPARAGGKVVGMVQSLATSGR